ncbi:MAG: AAA family ATPase [Pirellulaceae bacterium]
MSRNRNPERPAHERLKSGALHRANGGYLVLDALRMLQQPYAREGLKRALHSHAIRIESMAESLSLASTVSLHPEPIPLDVKVVLLGDRMQGEQVARVNGLSVMNLGNFAFGRPSRITATARLGRGNVVDIEREVDLGGSLHSKGVLIITSFLAARYAKNQPLALHASLVSRSCSSSAENWAAIRASKSPKNRRKTGTTKRPEASLVVPEHFV